MARVMPSALEILHLIAKSEILVSQMFIFHAEFFDLVIFMSEAALIAAKTRNNANEKTSYENP